MKQVRVGYADDGPVWFAPGSRPKRPGQSYGQITGCKWLERHCVHVVPIKTLLLGWKSVSLTCRAKTERGPAVDGCLYSHQLTGIPHVMGAGESHSRSFVHYSS
jgi:hypothetical protein